MLHARVPHLESLDSAVESAGVAVDDAHAQRAREEVLVAALLAARALVLAEGLLGAALRLQGARQVERKCELQK